MEKVYLTKLAPNCGCAAKVGPGTLAGVLCKLPKFHDEHLLVGTETSDDAAVYKISDELAMIQTLDFFTPVADDPYDFGQIAAANALSDVYAMGGEPKTALNIVAFPKEMDTEILGRDPQGRRRQSTGGRRSSCRRTYDPGRHTEVWTECYRLRPSGEILEKLWCTDRR